ncbi:hypothetical protein [Laribacter hongkongensis]|uniref:hypothetical protein n=1 Tax=Laribacter hongkongensis TaxID=168471 RepID=UPI001EFEB6AC|nr:hypothetical protein [Laribacter hongkongensis]MCG9100466.1 hypothetical protein [Laribacter hongkongensis]MCG9113299.1 hypothetical protein [Laribacter hongkongensis]
MNAFVWMARYVIKLKKHRKDMTKNKRDDAQAVNPLIGSGLVDTLENTVAVLEKMGEMMSNAHNDTTPHFFCLSVAGALRFELEAQRQTPLPVGDHQFPGRLT